jgi:sugar transferase (PEP-CTERM/EpsH1 system associated)
VKILVLTSRFPFPLEKGDKLRIFHQIRDIEQAGHEVVLCSLTDTPVLPEHRQALAAFCSKIFIFPQNKFQQFTNLLKGSILGNQAFSVSYFYNPKIAKKIQQIIENERPTHIYCQLVRCAEYLKNVELPKTLDYMDAFSVNAARRAQSSAFMVRWFWQLEARRLQKYECDIAQIFDYLTIISAQDCNMLPPSVAARVTIVPNGVATDFFNPIFKEKFLIENPNKTKYDLVFVGNMGYFPNIEAAKFLVKQVLPLLKKEFPHLRTLIAGARPSAEVVALGSETVTVSGWLDDIREGYAQGSIFVAPLLHGSGQQNKILEAMAMGLPCVTTPLVNNAIGATEPNEILCADTEGGIAAAIRSLLADPKTAQQVGKNGQKFVVKNFSWQRSTEKLVRIWLNLNQL